MVRPGSLLLSLGFSFFAAFASSPSYQLNSYSVGPGATNNAASTTYNLQGTVGEQANGSTSSTTYTAKNGSVQTEQLNVPLAPTLSNGSNTYYNKLNCMINTGILPSDTTYALAVSTSNFAATTLDGNSTIQSVADNDAAGTAEAFQNTASASGTTNTLNVYVNTGNAATTLIAGIYANSGSSPGTLLAQGSLSSPTAGAWNKLTLGSTISLTSGTTYWIAVLGTGGQLNFKDGGSSGTSQSSSSTSLTTLPSTWSSGTTFPTAGPLSAYAADNSTIGYVQANGTIGASPVYQTASTWNNSGSGTFIVGLNQSTSYEVEAAAKEGQFTNTEYGPYATATTESPSITFSVSPNTTNLGNLLPGSVTTSSNLSFSFATNAANGGDVYVSGQNNGLLSTTQSHTIAAFSGNLSGQSEGFGVQATNPSQSSGGPLVTVSPFNGTGNTVGAESIVPQIMLSTSAPIVGGTANANMQAITSTTTPSGTDYQEVLTFIASANF